MEAQTGEFYFQQDLTDKRQRVFPKPLLPLFTELHLGRRPFIKTGAVN